MAWHKELLDLLAKPLRTKYWIIKKRPWLIKLLCGFAFLLFLLFLIPSTVYFSLYYYTGNIPLVGNLRDDHGNLLDFDKLSKDNLLKSSMVRANDNKIIGRFFYENRDMAIVDDIPDLLKNAFIATEDKRFNPDRPNHLWYDPFCDWIYGGADPCAIVRAGFGHLFRYHNLSGASTIAQQVTRQTYPEEVATFRNRDQTIRRKIKEARVAIQLVKHHPKDKILLSLLNTSWFGHGINGVREACRYYFNKECDQLVLREAVILASMNKSAAIYCPIFHEPSEPADKTNEEVMKKYQVKLDTEITRIARMRERNNSVLGRMLVDGYITKKQYDEALFKKDEPRKLDLLNIQPLKNPDLGHVNRLVKEFVLGNGFTDKQITHTDGLQIYTTIDPKIQKTTTEEFEKHLEGVNQGLDPVNRVEGAFVIIEIKTGNIIALNGGYDYKQSQFNRVFAYRSPGSGYKPFVYAAALESGFDLFDKFCNVPFSMRGGNGKAWSPKNFKEKSPRPTDCNRDLAEGIIYSLNLETLSIARRITMDPIIALSNKLGIWGNPGIVRDSHGDIWFRRPHYEIKGGLVPLLPTAIGASDVNLLELANAYTVFFRHGIYKRPILIRELTDFNGKNIMTTEKSYEDQVLSEETADKVVAMMRVATKEGTSKISMRNIRQQIACKTGTSDGPRDVSIWCGSPDYLIGIRLGRDDYTVIELPEYMKKVSGDAEMQVSGGWIVGFLARKMFDRIYEDRETVEFSEKIEMYKEEMLNRYSRQ